jgi:octaprenyl-diphosphate synthase
MTVSNSQATASRAGAPSGVSAAPNGVGSSALAGVLPPAAALHGALINASLAGAVARLYEPVAHELVLVKARYREEFLHPDPNVRELLACIEHYSGKLLRPALLLLAGKACGKIREDHILLATVAEMIHTATLVHDDILDSALVRRGRPSINKLAGSEISVLLGDHLFSHALELALSLDDPTGARLFSRAVSRTCLGEVTQVLTRGNLLLTEEEYYRIVRGKTAELYATSTEIGAHYAGASERAARAMYDYGMKLGIAFQIMDDVLDLRGDEALVGKTLGTDLAGGKATLPVIHWLAHLAPAKRDHALERLRAAADPRVRREVVAELSAAGSIDYAESEARRIVGEAKLAATVVPDPSMREFFAHIADFVILREL